MPPRPLARAWTALPFALCLTACAQPPPPLVIPSGMASCPAEPPPPEALDDPALARWILDLREAGADCRSKLEAVGRLTAP